MEGSEEAVTIICDVGGTKTIVGRATLYETRGYHLEERRKFSSGDHRSLGDIVETYLEDTGYAPDSMVAALAGPVIDNRSKTTNLPWTVDGRSLERRLDIGRVVLLNDLEAAGYGIAQIPRTGLVTIKKGRRKKGGNMGVISPGTGLGESFVAWDGRKCRAFPTEGSHVEFGPRNDDELQLLTYLLERYDHVSYERVCSGIGLPLIYRFLLEKEGADDPLGIDHLEDPTPRIAEAGMKKKKIARQALDMWASVLGAEAGNLALKTMATGGIYLTGGMTSHLMDYLKGSPFERSFVSKGRMSHVVERIPVFAVDDPDIVMKGASRFASSAFL